MSKDLVTSSHNLPSFGKLRFLGALSHFSPLYRSLVYPCPRYAFFTFGLVCILSLSCQVFLHSISLAYFTCMFIFGSLETYPAYTSFVFVCRALPINIHFIFRTVDLFRSDMLNMFRGFWSDGICFLQIKANSIVGD